MAIEYDIKTGRYFGTLTRRYFESELEARTYETQRAGANRRAKADAGGSTQAEIEEIFIASTPSFVACKENGAAFKIWFDERGIVFDPETYLSNLRLCHDSLLAEGKLVMRGPLKQMTEVELEKLSTEELAEAVREQAAYQALRIGDR